jgi:hypothetical protein
MTFADLQAGDAVFLDANTPCSALLVVNCCNASRAAKLLALRQHTFLQSPLID